MRWIYGCMILVLLVSACSPAGGSPTTSSTAPANEPTPTREADARTPTADPGSGFSVEDNVQAAAFSAVIEGAASATMSGEGYYACENGKYVIRPLAQGLEQVTLILPPDIVPGVYRLADMGGTGPAATVSFSDGRVYAGRIDGVLVLNSVATSPGQAVSGSFDFTASNGAGEVSARGEFDFTSLDGVAYCNG